MIGNVLTGDVVVDTLQISVEEEVCAVMTER